MEKLIRDRVPEIAKARGQVLNVRQCGFNELNERLVAKLGEEAEEVANSGTLGEELEELADLMDVVYTLAYRYGWTRADLERAIARKRHTHGAFDKGYVLTTDECSYCERPASDCDHWDEPLD